VFDAVDANFMRRALALAKTGTGRTSPNPAVGCLIVRDGRIVGKGRYEYDLRDHAEVHALREASERSRNATAYVTLEPCCHHGRTPPCVDGLIQAGIRRVVVASLDPDPRVDGRGIKRLRSAGIRVDVGLLQEEAGRIIESYACHRATGTPLVVSKVGMSLDGKIGTGLKKGRWITSPESREFGQRLRLDADAVLVGVGTILFDDPELTYRAAAPKSRALIRIVLDTGLRTPPAARVFQACPESPVLIFCGRTASRSRKAELERQGAEIIRVPAFYHQLDLHAVLQELGKRDILGLLVEGGSRVHWSFVSWMLIDKFFFIVAPLVLGGKDAIPSVGGKGYGSAAEAPKFKIRRNFSIGPDMVIEAYPEFSRSIISPWISPESAASGERGSQPSSKQK
jgi:diaminohydroxyphosphoribosylaminopyrimidine deaminase/5-amino-6-(5-phosphoribosylamino)uracil reductase